MPLDSDISNADGQLHVEFYEKFYEQKPTDFVKILIPGDKTFLWDQPVRELDKERFPRHWLFYQMKKAGENAQAVGTPLSEWAASTKDEPLLNLLAQLQILKFQTVEQVAGMSDMQLQKIGMGAAGMRDKAKAFLATRNGAQVNEDREKLNRTEQELSFLKTQMAALIEQMNNRPPEPEKRGPGRPRKVIEDVEHNAPTGDSGNQ